jgi:hypothetical protein
MLYFEKEGFYIALIDHEKAGIVIRRGKIGEIGTAEINSKVRDTDYGLRNHFYDEYKKILSEGFVLVRREELEESVKKMWPSGMKAEHMKKKHIGI